MPRLSASLPKTYAPLLAELKSRVRSTQVRAALAASAELIGLYWHIGSLIARAQKDEGWGQSVIPRLAVDLQKEFPDTQGFSERNIGRMIAFFREYPDLFSNLPQAVANLPAGESSLILPQAVAQLDHDVKVPQAAAKLGSSGETPIVQQLAAQLPWGHHIWLIERVKNRADRFWYMQQAVTHGWSRSTLSAQIAAKAHRGAGKAITNFSATLPPIRKRPAGCLGQGHCW